MFEYTRCTERSPFRFALRLRPILLFDDDRSMLALEEVVGVKGPLLDLDTWFGSIVAWSGTDPDCLGRAPRSPPMEAM